jgi:hypothetical protein
MNLNYRVYYIIDGSEYDLFFSSSADSQQDLRFSAMYAVKQEHPGTNSREIKITDIIPQKTW